MHSTLQTASHSFLAHFHAHPSCLPSPPHPTPPLQDQEDFEGCACTLQDVLPKLPALVGKPIKDAVDTAANQVAGAGATAVDAVKGAATTAVGAVMDAGAKAGGAVAGAAEQAGGAIKSGLDTAGSTLKDVGSSIGSWFG